MKSSRWTTPPILATSETLTYPKKKMALQPTVKWRKSYYKDDELPISLAQFQVIKYSWGNNWLFIKQPHPLGCGIILQQKREKTKMKIQGSSQKKPPEAFINACPHEQAPFREEEKAAKWSQLAISTIRTVFSMIDVHCVGQGIHPHWQLSNRSF